MVHHDPPRLRRLPCARHRASCNHNLCFYPSPLSHNLVSSLTIGSHCTRFCSPHYRLPCSHCPLCRRATSCHQCLVGCHRLAHHLALVCTLLALYRVPCLVTWSVAPPLLLGLPMINPSRWTTNIKTIMTIVLEKVDDFLY